MVLNKLMEVYRLGPGSCGLCRRRFSHAGVSGVADLETSGRTARPSFARNRSSSQSGAMVTGWPRSRTRGAERLGPFEEEEIIESPLPPLPRGVSANIHPGDAATSVKFGEKEGDILVTTKITTWCEDRSGGEGRSSPTTPR